MKRTGGDIDRCESVLVLTRCGTRRELGVERPPVLTETALPEVWQKLGEQWLTKVLSKAKR